MRKTLVLSVLTIGSAIATGCGGGSSPEQGGFGTYQYESNGATITIEIPADTDQSLVATTEAYRLETGSAPVTYAIVNIDNSGGDESVSVFQFSVVTDDGATFEFKQGWQLVGDWQPSLNSNNRELYNRGVDLYNNLLNLDQALPGARSTALFIADGQVPSLKTLLVERNLLDLLDSLENGATPEPIRPTKVQSRPNPTSENVPTAIAPSMSPPPSVTVRPTAIQTPTPTSAPRPTAIPTQGLTTREFFNEKIFFTMEQLDRVFENPSAGRFSDELYFRFTIGNDTERNIRALTGDVVFSDLFDREIERLGITINDPIADGARIRFEDFFFDINQFIDSHERVFNTDLEDMIVTLDVESIIFEDGTRVDASDETVMTLPDPSATPTVTPTRTPRPTPTITPTRTPSLVPFVRRVELDPVDDVTFLVFPGWERLLKNSPDGFTWSIDLPQNGNWDFSRRSFSDGEVQTFSRFTTPDIGLPGIELVIVESTRIDSSTNNCTETLVEFGDFLGDELIEISDIMLLGAAGKIARFESNNTPSGLSDTHVACVQSNGANYTVSIVTWPSQAVTDGIAMLKTLRLTSPVVAMATPTITQTPVPTPSPTVTPEPTLVVESFSCEPNQNTGFAVTNGLVTNTTDEAIANIFVLVRWVDGSGQVIKTAQIVLPQNPFPGNSTIPFSVNTAFV